jgi:hypothetical protein
MDYDNLMISPNSRQFFGPDSGKLSAWILLNGAPSAVRSSTPIHIYKRDKHFHGATDSESMSDVGFLRGNSTTNRRIPRITTDIENSQKHHLLCTRRLRLATLFATVLVFCFHARKFLYSLPPTYFHFASAICTFPFLPPLCQSSQNPCHFLRAVSE